jgi:protein SEY1
MAAIWRACRLGADHRVVAVVGGQSSGKSTLLNHVLGLNFQTMDATGGRRQTTRGVWAGAARNVFALDVEGSDGREREEREKV